ncbi:hypothetical protein HNI00_02605 [Thermoleptolyngbya oregonensis NK1-22]|uniref:Uncharacterized protein n=1 Tax=Thermoleptolyngbya oregonensis NK1-22 TaxID=2547457 RepID=A0AA96Y248_9CYAN|nr:hypothetical protein [Thermoleptolyngbya oregonensis]WOB42180.1 hypothetical protein HNI00_02605 [Thermoleptolyngbya oregonensis NK1-22]
MPELPSSGLARFCHYQGSPLSGSFDGRIGVYPIAWRLALPLLGDEVHRGDRSIKPLPQTAVRLKTGSKIQQFQQLL